MSQTDAPPAPAPPTTGQKFAAETLGTFVLVLFGCGSFLIASQRYGSEFADASLLLITSIGLSFGFAVAVMIYAFGRISGGHFNPAVTVGAALSGRMAWSQTPVYIGGQLLGAIVAGGVLLVFGLGFDGFEAFDTSLGANGWGDDGTGYALWAALLIELVLTAIFVLVILAVTDERNEHPGMAPLVIGLTLAAIHFVAIPATGTSVNPARSIGPALFSGTDPIIQVWVFILGPLLGAAAAGLLYPAIFGRATDPVPGSGLNFGRPGVAAVPGYGMPDQYQQQWNQQNPAYPAAHAAAPAEQQASAQQGGWGEQPIIQDGWQWDPQAQQWIPAQQQAPQAPQAQWPHPDAGGGQTQVRPPDGV
ncbi:MIP/aquaporin family protein [Nocardioides sp. cx-173]|uniref:MIP/aquaporin family protein n=1 Tax=Nocardioides sp. cx-173 TaxID=2898796 RepID=UPI001E3717CD|nr:MIP family channel protein [Nocardioides sp. cx-173]MCD4524584.1 MIP family channel protein [Nocardioides sp. cx-173]UGB42932.1 MIP family channel protein [Nocardioides sp. cx-173]